MQFQLITGLKKDHFLIVCQLPEDSKDKMYTSTARNKKKIEQGKCLQLLYACEVLLTAPR